MRFFRGSATIAVENGVEPGVTRGISVSVSGGTDAITYSNEISQTGKLEQVQEGIEAIRIYAVLS
jgi:hypothetical protein